MRDLLIRLAGLLAIAWIYAPAAGWIVDRWFAADSYYAHGPLIPVVSAALVWRKRAELSALKPVPSRWGQLLVGAAFALQLASALFRVYFASALSFILLLAGGVLCYGGWPLFRRVAFPLAFLLFMVPLPLAAIAQISLNLKLRAATMASGVLGLLGIPVLQKGSILYMPHGTVIVEDVCSGLRSLIALIALGVLCTHLLRAAWWKRAVLLALTVPIALGSNIFRITTVCLATELYGARVAGGSFHDTMGAVSFLLAYAAMVAASRWLQPAVPREALR